MEMEPTPPNSSKKLWNIVRICILMLKKIISKSKLMIDLNTLIKKSKIAGQALGQVMFHHHQDTLGCRFTDVQPSYVSAKEYEFSCSNTPLYAGFSSRKKHQHRHHYSRRTKEMKLEKRNILDVLKNYETPVEASPLVGMPGFGVSPNIVRQLRITDSPFPLKGEENEDGQVDKMAEEFISKFYKDLRKQKRVAALQSPSPYHMRAS